MRRHTPPRWAYATAATTLIACTSDGLESDPEPGEPPIPSYTMPEVWGVPVLEDIDPREDFVEVHLHAQHTQWALADGSVIHGVAYNGMVPGPLLQAKLGDEVSVHFHNDLGEHTTVHWHGLRISDLMDGSPRVQEPVRPGDTFGYRFTPPEAATFWYHPHVNAHLQVEKGLQGALIIHDPEAPTYDLERFLVLDDLLIDASGNIPPPLASMPEAMHGRWGNTLLTNGQQAELVRGVAQQGQVERWRLVNTANARSMKLSVEGAQVRVIATDGGLLPEPYVAPHIELPVGQRFDLEVTYDQPGEVTIQSHVLTVNANDDLIQVPHQVFAVDVAPSDIAPRIIDWPAVEPLPTRVPDSEVEIRINAVQNALGGVSWQLNEKSHSHDPLFVFQQGQTVRIALTNELGPEHPFHLHGQFFQIEDPTRPGLKDTVLVPGLSTVSIVAYMDNPGRWMAHCHILEHAELGMMSEIYVEAVEGADPPDEDPGEHKH